MIHFVTSLPPTLEANAIYYVQINATTAEHYVTDDAANAVQVTTAALVQAYLSTLKGAANGYAELDSSSKVPLAQLPDSLATDTELAAKANSADVYTQTAVDALVNAKQDTLSNAADVAKIGNGTFDGDPIVTIATSEW